MSRISSTGRSSPVPCDRESRPELRSHGRALNNLMLWSGLRQCLLLHGHDGLDRDFDFIRRIQVGDRWAWAGRVWSHGTADADVVVSAADPHLSGGAAELTIFGSGNDASSVRVVDPLTLEILDA